MFDLLGMFSELCLRLREQIGAVKITTHRFSKVCDCSTTADVKGNDGGDANAQWECDGAATLETWIHSQSVKGSSQVPLLSTHSFWPCSHTTVNWT